MSTDQGQGQTEIVKVDDTLPKGGRPQAVAPICWRVEARSERGDRSTALRAATLDAVKRATSLYLDPARLRAASGRLQQAVYADAGRFAAVEGEPISEEGNDSRVRVQA